MLKGAHEYSVRMNTTRVIAFMALWNGRRGSKVSLQSVIGCSVCSKVGNPAEAKPISSVSIKTSFTCTPYDETAGVPVPVLHSPHHVQGLVQANLTQYPNHTRLCPPVPRCRIKKRWPTPSSPGAPWVRHCTEKFWRGARYIKGICHYIVHSTWLSLMCGFTGMPATRACIT